MERIGLVVHSGRPVAVEAAERVRAWARRRGVPLTDVDVWGDGADAARRSWADAPERLDAKAEAEASGHPDLVVTIGGDGTFLRGARVAMEDGAAVLGVDVGRVGFLTEVSPGDVEEALDAIADSRAQVEERLTLTMRASRPLELPEGMEALLRYGRGPALPPPDSRDVDPEEAEWGVDVDVVAVNDIVLEKLARDRQASLGLYIGGTHFASYSADALVVGTATGSTAYSFSAGGPILSPQLRALVFTPVAPHMVFDRSLVLSPEEEVAIRVLERSGQVAVSIDGQLRGVLDPGDWVSVRACADPVKLVRLREPDFFTRLRNRFALADAPAAVADDGSPGAQRRAPAGASLPRA